MGLDVATNLLKTLETSSSIGMFARDTGGCLISRLSLARSKDEMREVTIAETTESALFYFSAPLLAKGCADIFSKALQTDKSRFTSPLESLKDAGKYELKRIKLGKFAQIGTVFSAILPFVFGIAPVRNLVTLSKTGKDKFTNVVGLENKEEERKSKEAKEKALDLSKKLVKASAIELAGTLSVLALSKNNNIYKKIEPLIDKVIKHFDFTKTGDLELMHYGALIYPASIAGYFYASRDKYEKQENLRRFSITVPLLFFGEKLIQNPIHRHFDKKFGTEVMDKMGNIKPYKEILKMEEPLKSKFLKSKNFSYGSTFLINTMAIAAAVALLNRVETKKNYEKDLTKNTPSGENKRYE